MSFCDPGTLQQVQVYAAVVLGLTVALIYTVPALERAFESARRDGGGWLLAVIPATGFLVLGIGAWVVSCS